MLGLDLMQTAYKDSSLQHYSYFVSFVLNGVLRRDQNNGLKRDGFEF